MTILHLVKIQKFRKQRGRKRGGTAGLGCRWWSRLRLFRQHKVKHRIPPLTNLCPKQTSASLLSGLARRLVIVSWSPFLVWLVLDSNQHISLCRQHVVIFLWRKKFKQDGMFWVEKMTYLVQLTVLAVEFFSYQC